MYDMVSRARVDDDTVFGYGGKECLQGTRYDGNKGCTVVINLSNVGLSVVALRGVRLVVPLRTIGAISPLDTVLGGMSHYAMIFTVSIRIVFTLHPIKKTFLAFRFVGIGNEGLPGVISDGATAPLRIDRGDGISRSHVLREVEGLFDRFVGRRKRHDESIAQFEVRHHRSRGEKISVRGGDRGYVFRGIGILPKVGSPDFVE